MKKILDALYRRFLKKPEEMTLLELVRYGNRLKKKRYVKPCLDSLFETLFARILVSNYKTLNMSDTNRFDTIKEDLVSGAFGYLDENTSREEWGVKEAYEILRYFDFTYGWHDLEQHHGIVVNGIWDVVVGTLTVFVTDDTGHLENIVGDILQILEAENQESLENPQKGENE